MTLKWIRQYEFALANGAGDSVGAAPIPALATLERVRIHFHVRQWPETGTSSSAGWPDSIAVSVVWVEGNTPPPFNNALDAHTQGDVLWSALVPGGFFNTLFQTGPGQSVPLHGLEIDTKSRRSTGQLEGTVWMFWSLVHDRVDSTSLTTYKSMWWWSILYDDLTA